MFDNDYIITGKHASYLKALARTPNDNEETAKNKIFERYIDVYMNAAVWGLISSRKVKRNKDIDDTASILAAVFYKERETCIFLYRLVILIDGKDLNDKERIDRAFHYDMMPEKSEQFKQNMEIFNDYVRGGIEEMYEKFIYECHTRSDYLNKMYEVMIKFKDEIDNAFFEDEVEKLIN